MTKKTRTKTVKTTSHTARLDRPLIENSPEMAAPTRRTAIVMVVTGALGLFASFMLSIEEFTRLKNPTDPLTCDLNPIVGCSSILDTWQGHVIFGIPNQFFGMMAFTAFLTFGVLMLSRVKFPRWIWQALQIGVIGGVFYVGWFVYQSLAVLNHLCPYCMLTWGTTLVAAWYVTLYNLAVGHIPESLQVHKFADKLEKHHVDVIVAVVIVIVLLIAWRFWWYWSTLF